MSENFVCQSYYFWIFSNFVDIWKLVYLVSYRKFSKEHFSLYTNFPPNEQFQKKSTSYEMSVVHFDGESFIIFFLRVGQSF